MLTKDNQCIECDYNLSSSDCNENSAALNDAAMDAVFFRLKANTSSARVEQLLRHARALSTSMNR